MIDETKVKVQNDVILVRHAQSTYNEATVTKSRELGLTGVWDDFIKSDVFNQMVTYNQTFIDAPLSQFGRTQCQTAEKQLENTDIDMIIVSPTKRSMETCKRIFGDRKIPVMVEPLAMEVFRYSCDVSASLEQKKQMFPDYDFSKVQELGQEWYLQILHPDIKEQVLRLFKEREIETLEQKQKAMLEFLSQKIVYETSKDLRARIAKLKQVMKEYRQKYQKIVVVAHFYTIQFIKSTGFREDGNVCEIQEILNCHPYYESLEELLKVQ